MIAGVFVTIFNVEVNQLKLIRKALDTTDSFTVIGIAVRRFGDESVRTMIRVSLVVARRVEDKVR